MSASKKKKPQEKHRHDLINGCEQSDYVVCERVLMTKTKLFILKAESVCQTVCLVFLSYQTTIFSSQTFKSVSIMLAYHHLLLHTREKGN